MKQSADLVEKVVQDNLDQKEFDWSHLKQDVREKLNRFLFDQTKRHPVILPVIMEINQHAKRKSKGNNEAKKNNNQKEKSQGHHHSGRGRGRKHEKQGAKAKK